MLINLCLALHNQPTPLHCTKSSLQLGVIQRIDTVNANRIAFSVLCWKDEKRFSVQVSVEKNYLCVECVYETDDIQADGFIGFDFWIL